MGTSRLALRQTSILTSIALLLAVGCSASPSDDSVGAGGASGGGGAVAGGAGTPPGTGGVPPGTGGVPPGTGGAPPGTGGVPPGTGGAPPGTGGAPPGTGGVPPGTGGSVATSCEPANVFSDAPLRDCNLPGACGRCLWEKACPQFLYQCARNAECVCMAECIGNLGVGAAGSCLGNCGLTANPPGFAQFAKSASDMCWDEGCGTYSVPPAEAPGPTDVSIGAGTEPSCFFDSNLRYDPCGPIIQLQSADRNICVRIDLRDDGPGPDANSTWTLLDVLVGPLGQVCHTADPAALCWFSSHHNYTDFGHVSCGNRHYDLEVTHNCGVNNFSGSPSYRLHVFESGPAASLGCAPTTDGVCRIGTPIDLFPVP